MQTLAPTSEQAAIHTISSIQVLFRHDESLCHFLFHHQETRLSDSAQNLLEDSRVFGDKEQILIQIALDFWSNSGSASVFDIVYQLDNEELLAFMRAILRLREIDLYVDLVEEPRCFD
jgi:hypothetical protein